MYHMRITEFDDPIEDEWDAGMRSACKTIKK